MAPRAGSRRHFTRVPFDCEARLLSSDSADEWPAQLIDISLKGALITQPEDWQGKRSDKFHLDILLSGESIKVAMDVSVAHVEDRHIGFHCDHIDIDSASHLHRLMELNLGDAALLEREIHEMLVMD